MNTMQAEPKILIYTIKRISAGEGKRPLVRLDGLGWPTELGIDHIQFSSQRGAAYFAQHHAAGRPATLRVMSDGLYCGDRPIPPIDEIPVPAAHEDHGFDFMEFFRSWPMSFELEKRKVQPDSGHPPAQLRSSKVADHPASFRWTPSGPPANPRVRS